MEGINEHNCLEWFIAYHEGMLDSSGRQSVERFLILHPDFSEDFERLGDTFLKVPQTSPSTSFSHLKKIAGNTEENNPDWLAARFAFGDITLEEEAGISAQIKSEAALLSKMVLLPAEVAFPDKTSLRIPDNDVVPAFISMAGSEARSFASLVLRPENRVILPEKALLKNTTTVRVISLRRAFYYAASVAAVLLVAAGLFLRSGNSGSIPALAVNRIEANNTARSLSPAPMPDKEEAQEMQAVRVHPKEEAARENVTPGTRMETMAAISPIKVHLPLLDEPAHRLRENDGIAGLNGAEAFERKSGNTGYISLSEFARRKIKQRLVGDENPEGGFTSALAGKAGERLSEKTGKPVAIELSKTDEGRKAFHFRYGQFAISRNTP